MGAVISKPVVIEDKKGFSGIVQGSRYLRYPGICGDTFNIGGGIGPRFSTVSGYLNIPIIGTCPYNILLDG